MSTLKNIFNIMHKISRLLSSISINYISTYLINKVIRHKLH